MTDVSTRRNTARSQELFAKAAEHLAGGVGSGTRSPRSGWRPSPIFIDRGTGSRVLDVDGNEYIDYMMGQGPLILGHRPPELIEALTSTISERGSLAALCHDLEGPAAAAVSERIPSMELLRFGNSGTECVMYALRFARAFTGRNVVVRFEGHYHGWSDAIHWSAHPSLDAAGPADAPAVTPASTGIPPELAETLIVLPWNDAEALGRAFAARGDEIAAVITEPIMGNAGGLMPAPGYLETMREVTTRHGAILIFDEVLTGLRVGRGGAQELFGVTPDLTVLAKALAAGFPVAAVGGRRDIMEMVVDGRTMHGGTYNSNFLACASVIAALEATGRPGFYEDLVARGARLADGLVQLATDAGIESCWTGIGSLFQVWLGAPAPTEYRSSQELVARSPFPTFHAEMLERRVLLQPPQEGLFLMSAAHTDEDVERTLELAADAMPAVASSSPGAAARARPEAAAVAAGRARAPAPARRSRAARSAPGSSTTRTTSIPGSATRTRAGRSSRRRTTAS
jgi:glutamate-1-semialdehyde 2,1-aminomutase